MLSTGNKISPWRKEYASEGAAWSVKKTKAPTARERSLQREIADEWIEFRALHLFTQEKFAETLGISRRTVQYVEQGNKSRPGWLCMPLPETMKRFQVLKRKFAQETPMP